MDTIAIREATHNDLDAIASLYMQHWCRCVPDLEDKVLAARMCVLIQLVRSQFALIAEQDGTVVGVCLGSRIVNGAVPEIGMWKSDYERIFAEATERAKTADAALEGSLFDDWRELQTADRFIATGSPYAQAQLTLFMMDSQLKGRGLGFALLSEMKRRFREAGAGSFFLMTDTESDCEYYERRGMRLLDRIADNPDDPGWAVLMYGGEL